MFATLVRLTRPARPLPNPKHSLSYARLHLGPQPALDNIRPHLSPEMFTSHEQHVRLVHFRECRGFGPAIAARLVDSGCQSWADVIAKDDQPGTGVALNRSQKIHLYHHLELDGYLDGEDARGVIGEWAARVVRC